MKTYKLSDGILLPHPFQWHEQWDGQQLTTVDALELYRTQLIDAITNAKNVTLDQQGQDDLASDLLQLEALDANLNALIEGYHINLANGNDILRSDRALNQIARAVTYDPDETAPLEAGEFQLSPGGTILDLPDEIASLWGTGEQILWAKGEPLMIYGPTGIGKTTVAGNLILSLIGIRPPKLLHYPITPLPNNETVLYVAADRPRQAMRSLKRMVTNNDRTTLDQRLRIEHHRQIWTHDQDPNNLHRACQQANATVILLDSTKDIASGPLKEEATAKAFMDAIQVCIANEIEVLMLHHPRKGSRDTTSQEQNIDSVYGSTWLTAGSGSVLLVDGLGGSGHLIITQLKAPATFIQPMEAAIDYETGTLERRNVLDVLEWLKGVGQPMTTGQAVAYYYRVAEDDPKTASGAGQYQEMKKKLDGMNRAGEVKKIGGKPIRWQWQQPLSLDTEGLDSGV